MKRTKVLLGLGLALVFAVGCGATTKSTIAYHDETLRGTDDAIVYIFRQQDMVGAVAVFNVYIDGKLVGALKQDAYMPIHLPPGPHAIQIGEHHIDPIAREVVETTVNNPEGFRAKAGDTYYILSKGFYVSFPTKDQALPILQTMKYDMGN